MNSRLSNSMVSNSIARQSRSVRFSSEAVRLFPALLDEGVRPSYGTFFLMVFQGNSARVRTGHMINWLILEIRTNDGHRIIGHHTVIV